jgi:hypothetical protein
VKVSYAEGEIVPTDVARAAEWFREGATQGRENCQLQLIFMRELGVAIPQDAVLVRRASVAAAEPGTPSDESSEEEELSDEDEDDEGVPAEYLTHLLTVFDNYKAAARRHSQS